MPIFYDQLNRPVNLTGIPKRIISVVPSQTELLFNLGLTDEVIGITKFCIHPHEKFRTTEKVGGTKQLDLEKIKALHPDLIIANKEENDKAQIEALAEFFPVWISDIGNLTEAIDMIEKVGDITNCHSQAHQLSVDILRRFNEIDIPRSGLDAAYFIWRKPYMIAGKNTFIDAMLQVCGLNNVFKEERYPEISEADLLKAKPQLILLSSEPYPFGEKHIAELQRILPLAAIKLVDGELFSWYGSRLLHAPAYFKQLTAGFSFEQKN
jgi:ABC-type Fe3+-hydroxamate transport system substrate-binding protein